MKRFLMGNIENFPDEIFYEIFDYLDGCDIYKAFSNLNNRFERLFTYSSFLPKIHCKSMVRSLFEYYCKEYILPNRNQIFSLHLHHPTNIDIFFKLCMIDPSFNRLQSIVLYGIKSEKIVRLLDDLKRLPRLISLIITVLYMFADLNAIYKRIFSLPVLKYNQFSFLSIEKSEQQTILFPNKIHEQIFSSIEHLKLGHYCTVDGLLSLLVYTPRISHLTCRNLIESRDNNDQEVLIKVPYLTFLSIEDCDLSFDKSEIFIKKISSHLQVFRMKTSKETTYLDANRWEHFIFEHIPHLRKFYFIYHESISYQFHPTSYHTLINLFISQFWIRRQWLFEIKIESNEIIYSIHPYRLGYDPYIGTVPKPNVDLSSSIQLTIATYLFNEGIKLSDYNINFIFTLLPITALNVDCHRMHTDSLMQLIQLIPKLHSLKVSSLSPPKAISSSNEEEKTNQLVSNKNIIRKVTLEKLNRIQEVDFLINLCPSMEYFEIDGINYINLDLLIESVLIKNKDFIPHLCLLCLKTSHPDDNIFHKLEEKINHGKLIQNYTIKRICNRIYLQWGQDIRFDQLENK